jgi:beta-N-acetylhexosaminidase
LVGVNLNFAPVLDVNSNPANPIIGDRAFGVSAEQVIKHAWAWLDGLRDGGIIPCGKHFPGHGDTDCDSHLALPTVVRPLNALKSVELPPFVHACKQGIESLMTAHVRYPALDPKLPATLSEAVVTGLLRHQLGYEGVVFSDDLEMKAITSHFSVTDTAALAVHAGVDIMLFCHELEPAVEAYEFLRDQAERDPFMRAQIEKSCRRITALKQRCLKTFTGVDAEEFSAQLRRLDHRRLIAEVFGGSSSA